ncbi:MAG: acyl-CoA thioesterase [Crocinitomicaceae bacterium]|nr:acyl-CoA thioesterase [Crocinitomicaceae bacterium]
MKELKYKKIKDSLTVFSELMVPSYANFGGKVHGGTILSIMDKIAYVCATKHAGNYCVTASVETVDFLSPVDVGDQLSLFASVNYVGKSSLVIGIKVISENLKKGTVRDANTSYFTMVAMDDDHRPVRVPGLLLETHVEVRRFLEAKKRKEMKNYNKEEFRKAKQSMESLEEIHTLQDENCKIQIVQEDQ